MYEEFKSMVSSSHGSDNTISLWNDKCNTDTLHQLYPQLHLCAKNKSISMASSRISNQSDNLFHLPLSTIADQQCEELQVSN
jgi:hypothetical protein